MANRYISDTHFGHKNIIGFDNRPFFGVEDMEKDMVNNWNSVTSPGDTVHILGDFCWGTAKEWPRVLEQLNGNKVLIRGNHDLKEMPPEVRRYFQDVKDYKEITDGGYHVIMAHFPMLFYKRAYLPDYVMLCGHVHRTRENDFLEEWSRKLRESRTNDGDSYGQVINVGCMMPYINYTPRTLEEILAGHEAYTKQRFN